MEENSVEGALSSTERKGIWEFIGKRWFEFRYGHTLYLIFLMSFTNFILIFYNFGLGESSGMSVVTFSLVFILLYVPVAIVVGYLHRIKQLRIDMVKQWEQNPQFVELMNDVRQLVEDMKKVREDLGELREGS